jgi:NAD-dependent SIR2 family protein deacetylase
MSNIHYYLADPEVRKLSWQNRLSSPAWAAQPNAGHLALVELERRKKLHALITQNIDELHQIAGNSPERVIEVHGTMRRFMCWGCGMRGPMQLVLERVRAGEADPPCRDCGGVLKSDTISFGQQLVPEVIDRAMQAAGEAEPAGLPGRGRGGHRALRRGAHRHRQRAAHAVRRSRRRRLPRVHQRDAASAVRFLRTFSHFRW